MIIISSPSTQHDSTRLDNCWQQNKKKSESKSTSNKRAYNLITLIKEVYIRLPPTAQVKKRIIENANYIVDSFFF